jgi:nicotinate phosphoribosyltransferase
MTYNAGSIGLYTDYYELTMARGYYEFGRQNESAVFDYFFRTNPFQNGFTVFAGLRDFLQMIEKFRFSDNDLQFLAKQGFPDAFCNFWPDFDLGEQYIV